MKEYHPDERVVAVHTANTLAEAMVIRGLLESAGIDSPGSASTDPFPLNESADMHGLEIYVRESQADDARRVISENTAGNSAAST